MDTNNTVMVSDIEQIINDALGYRSPSMSLQHGGNASPGQGRSVREFEEQMASLRNENFNLKLRLYFVEQKVPGYNSSANSSSDGQESLLKQNVDLKVDNEILKKELQQKQSLLCEAAKAMELMEEQQKENDEKSHGIIEELNQRIQYLEEENKHFERSAGQQNMDQLMGRSDLMGDVDILQKVRELEGQVKHYEAKTDELISKQTELEQLVVNKDESLTDRENTIKQLEFQIAELQEQLDEKAKDTASLEKKYEDRTRKLTSEKETETMKLSSENKSLHMSLDKLKAELEREKLNFEDRNKKLKEQQRLMEEMQLTIINRKNNSMKLSKTIDEYEKVISELRAEQRTLSKENRNLKDIIVKLEHSKLKEMETARNLDIYLGKSMNTGGKEDRQLERRRLLPGTHKNEGHSNHQKQSPNSNHFLANPLFRQLSGDYENIGDTGGSRTTDLRLKEKLCYDTIKTINTQSIVYQDPGFYIRETKTYHNANLNGMKYIASSGGGSARKIVKDESEINTVKNLERAMKSLNKGPMPLERVINSPSQQEGALISSESSETSLVSCLSHLNPETGANFKLGDDILASEIEKHNARPKNTKLKEELYECKSQLANKICELSTVEERLQEKTTLYEKSCKAIQKLMQNTKELQHEVDKLKKSSGSQTMSYIKENTESTYGTDPTGLCDSNVNATSTSPTRKLEAMLVKKDAEIVNLKQEVKRKTANLQTLINKELWEKNREIERLTKLVKSNGRTSSSPVREVDPLQHSFSDSDYIHALEQNKRLQLKVDKLIQKLSVVNERNADQSIQQLKQQLREAREDAERAERWRKECADLCSVLTERLEELAGFLDSLLSHKDILGSLGADRRKAMRKAVERSLELSRSLNSMSLSLSVTSIGDHGLEILGNITSILDQTSDKENRTFNCLNEPANSRNNQVIESLRAEVKALKKELEKKKAPDSVKKERRSLPSKFDNQSESEAWSEPDRNVSMARIGLEESLGAKIVAKATKESGTGNTSTDSLADVTRKSKAKQHDKITQLEQIISQKENRILQAQCDLVDADNRLKKETLRRLEINDELEKYRKLNAKLEAEMKMLKEQTSNYEAFAGEVDQYKKQIEEKQAALDKVTLLRDQLTADIHVAESKMQSLSDEYDALKQNYEHDLEAAVLKEQEKMNAKEIELSRKYEEKLEQIENNHKEYLAREWISRVIYEQTKRELEDVQKKLTEAQFTVDFLRENETELNEQLIENEKQRRTLKQNLDEATLQSSKIVVERTKAVTEKLQLEAQLQELMTELTTIKHERDLILEQNNILHNQVMNATAEIKKAVKRASSGSDLSHTRSGYTSEDAAIAAISRNERNVVQRLDNSSPDLGIESDAGRTSSTDHGAGIEENAYRAVLRPKAEVHPLNIVDEGGQGVSSTTTTNPAQSTKIDATNSNSSTVALETTVSVTGHDCARVDQENAELRRKVIRQKRALENTWNSLRAANQRKEQIEHGIRLQILKTQNVLNCVRTNIETELATPKKESPQK